MASIEADLIVDLIIEELVIDFKLQTLIVEIFLPLEYISHVYLVLSTV